MSKKSSSPIRTCIACRKRRKKEEMIWLARSPEGVVKVNPRTPHQGRGYYLCPDLGCFNRAKKKNRGIESLEIMEFRIPYDAKRFFNEKDERERGGRE